MCVRERGEKGGCVCVCVCVCVREREREGECVWGGEWHVDGEGSE